MPKAKDLKPIGKRYAFRNGELIVTIAGIAFESQTGEVYYVLHDELGRVIETPSGNPVTASFNQIVMFADLVR